MRHHALPGISLFSRRICLAPGCFACSFIHLKDGNLQLCHSFTIGFSGYRNINLFGIRFGFRLHVSFRLTQGGRTFPWNPWALGVQDSHLHLATHTGILSSLSSTALSSPASMNKERSPTTWVFLSIQIQSFGSRLSPVTSSAQNCSTSELLRTLSRMAASKPTF